MKKINKYLAFGFSLFLMLPFISVKEKGNATKADDYEMYHLPVGNDVPITTYQDPMIIKVTDDNREELFNTVIGNSTRGETYDPDQVLFNATPTLVETQGGRLIYGSMRGDNNEPNDNNYTAIAISDDGGETWVDPVLIIDDNNPTTRQGDVATWVTPYNELYIMSRISDNTIIDMNTGNQHGNIYCDHVALTKIDNPDDDVIDWHINHIPVMFEESGYSSINTLRCFDVIYEDGHELYAAVGQCGGKGSLSARGKFFVSEDKGQTWYLRSFLEFPSVNSLTFIEPTFCQMSNGDIWVPTRIEGGNQGGVGLFISHDYGKTWTYQTGMGAPFIGPGSHGYIRRLNNGNIVWSTNFSTTTRENLRIYLSEDDGQTWPYEMNIDYRSASTYPFVYSPYVGNRTNYFYVSTDNGRGGNRELRFARLTPEDIKYGEPITKNSLVHGLIGMNKNYHQIESIDEELPYVLRLKKDAYTRQDLLEYLPTRLNATLDNGQKIVLNGQWNLSEVMLGKPGTYYIKFECSLPSQVVDGKNLFLIQIRIGQHGNEITSIDEVFENNVDVDFGTPLSSITRNLPTTIHATNMYGISFTLTGSWLCDNYKENKAGRYKITFKANNAPIGLDDSNNLLTVTVKMAVNPNAVDSDLPEVVLFKDQTETSVVIVLIAVGSLLVLGSGTLLTLAFKKNKKEGGNR